MAHDRPDGLLLSDGLIAQVLAFPPVRPDAVQRGRDLLGTPTWCRAEEVASELVDCLVGGRLP